MRPTSTRHSEPMGVHSRTAQSRLLGDQSLKSQASRHKAVTKNAEKAVIFFITRPERAHPSENPKPPVPATPIASEEHPARDRTSSKRSDSHPASLPWHCKSQAVPPSPSFHPRSYKVTIQTKTRRERKDHERIKGPAQMVLKDPLFHPVLPSRRKRLSNARAVGEWCRPQPRVADQANRFRRQGLAIGETKLQRTVYVRIPKTQVCSSPSQSEAAQTKTRGIIRRKEARIRARWSKSAVAERKCTTAA